jgi:hypothetical protein
MMNREWRYYADLPEWGKQIESFSVLAFALYKKLRSMMMGRSW